MGHAVVSFHQASKYSMYCPCKEKYSELIPALYPKAVLYEVHQYCTSCLSFTPFPARLTPAASASVRKCREAGGSPGMKMTSWHRIARPPRDFLVYRGSSPYSPSHLQLQFFVFRLVFGYPIPPCLSLHRPAAILLRRGIVSCQLRARAIAFLAEALSLVGSSSF